MADTKVSALDTLGSIDRTADYLYVVDATGPTSNKMTVNSVLGFTGGNPVSTSDTQTLTNKTITSPTLTVLDNVFTIQDNSDTTKQLQFQLSGITTATTRTLTIPDASTTLVGTDATQTLTNKTLTSPTINTATIVNPTITTDTISEYTGANGVSVDGLNIKDSKLNTNNSVVTANITDAAVTPAKLVAGTGSSWAYQSYSPTYTNVTVENGTTVAKYCQMGKMVHYYGHFTLGTTSAVSGSVIISLPVTASASYKLTYSTTGDCTFVDQGTTGYHGWVRMETTSTIALIVMGAATTSVNDVGTSSSSPHTWANSDVFTWNCWYEAA